MSRLIVDLYAARCSENWGFLKGIVFLFVTYSKTLLKLTIPRIKLLRNRREIQLKQMRRDIAKLLETGQEATARIRVQPPNFRSNFEIMNFLALTYEGYLAYTSDSWRVLLILDVSCSGRAHYKRRENDCGTGDH